MTDVTTTLDQPAQRYDSRTIALHWTTAALVALSWGMAQIIDYFPRGSLRVDARSVHITLGIAVAVVLAIRLFHRATLGRRLPPEGGTLLNIAAKVTHFALYALLIAQVILGFANTYVRGDSFFNLFALPGTADTALRHQVGGLHGLVANVILIVAGIHAAAALVHHFVFRDNVLRRMGSASPAS